MSFSASEYAKDILLRKTDRDQSRRVGPSNLSNECTRCLADDMLNAPREQGVYNMGAIIGTAIHAYLEERNLDELALREQSNTVGYIEGYGTIKGTTDLYLPQYGAILDWKTTTRDKLEKYKKADTYGPSKWDVEGVRIARKTIERYFRQTQLYALGMENAGYTPETLHIVFLCRDGQIVDRDVYALQPRPYNHDTAKYIFLRAQRLWQFLEWGGDPEELNSDDDCYYCNRVRPYVTQTTQEEVEL